jgi:hypothetical protein
MEQMDRAPAARPSWLGAVIGPSSDPVAPDGFVAVDVDAFQADAGAVLAWRRPDDWELRNARCRWTVGPGHLTCKKPPVAMLARSRYGSRGPVWWAYCGRHLYRRRIDAQGRLVERRLLDAVWAGTVT